MDDGSMHACMHAFHSLHSCRGIFFEGREREREREIEAYKKHRLSEPTLVKILVKEPD